MFPFSVSLHLEPDMKSAGWFDVSTLFRGLRQVTSGCVLASILSVALISPAYAYLDPGSAAIVTQLLIGAFAAASAYLGHKFELFKKLFSRGDRRKPRTDDSEDDDN